MFVKSVNKNKREIEKFQFAYEVLHPEEISPSYDIIKGIEKEADKVFIGSYNICLFKQIDENTYSAIAYWCIASPKLPNSENRKCFIEARKMNQVLRKKVLISNIQKKYERCVEKIGDNLYIFKASK